MSLQKTEYKRQWKREVGGVHETRDDEVAYGCVWLDAYNIPSRSQSFESMGPLRTPRREFFRDHVG
jgi:hypothetical protein